MATGQERRERAARGEWWRDAVVYQIYPRSFADGDGDGIGDFAGIISRVDYLIDLGIDAVWLNPFYPSALADGGYDVDDYRAVHPQLGTLSQFDALVGALHAADIKVIVDIVPNHSGSGHEWFRAALASAPGSPERARYIFRDGRGAGGGEPPSDWVSHFGGSAWTQVPDGQWYLHLFAPEQPDFDWGSGEVRAEFHDVLRFWADRGVDGFRVDVAHALAKDLTEPLRSYPQIAWDRVVADGTDPLFDRDEVHEIYRGWRAVMNEYDPPRMAVAEVWAPAPRVPLYARPDELGQAFAFDLSEQPWDATAFRDAIRRTLAQSSAVGAPPTWVMSNHDLVRHASRFGLPPGTDFQAWLRTGGTNPHEDHALGARRARAATMLILGLPGSTYLYQGEELGLPEVADLPRSSLEDPLWKRSQHQVKGRDGSRVPLPWQNTGPSLGFGGAAPHLPQPEWFARYSVEAERCDPSSMLSFYRAALRLRKTLQAGPDVELVEAGSDVVEFMRGGRWRSITAFHEPRVLPPGEVLLASGGVLDGVLPAGTTAWIRDRPASHGHPNAG